jgi:hypothetical protein
MRERWRLQLVCEDRLTERFVRRLCEEHGIELLRDGVHVAPSGKGAATAWVIDQYAHQVSSRRSKNFQHRLALLFVVDGDSVGVDARLRALEQRLSEQRRPPRTADEPIAVFVPTWSVETWIAHLCGEPDVVESEPLKRDPRLRRLWDDDLKSSLGRAAENWAARPTTLHSLERAYSEAPRIQLKGQA